MWFFIVYFNFFDTEMSGRSFSMPETAEGQCSNTSLLLCQVRLGLGHVSALAATSGTGLFVFSPE